MSLPWLLAELFSHHPVLSFFIAFLGSFFIFYLTIFSRLRCLGPQRAISEQVMKPIVLLQLIFAGLMCCTSIFYFADHLGYHYLNQVSIHHTNEQTYLLAKCQRLALLGHIALVLGIISQIKPERTVRYTLNFPLDVLLLRMSILLLIAIYILKDYPSLHQFSIYMMALAASCQILLLIRGLAKKKPVYITYGGIFFVVLLLNSTLTGYKEAVIVNIITCSFLAFPYFKKTVALFFVPVLCVLFYFLPTFTTVIRTLSWNEKKAPQNARAVAYDTIIKDQNELLIQNNNWQFLTRRLSEIEMFCQYVKDVPEHHTYYGSQILKNSVIALVPRVIWNQKPETEKVAMERVYSARVVNRLSPVSAKTRPVIDGYLSAGLIGVFLGMFSYGLISQWLSNKAEELFGGYQLGCAIIFNSLFQQLWRGNNWEFLINNIVYGYIIMLILFWGLKYLNILKLNAHDNRPTHHTIL